MTTYVSNFAIALNVLTTLTYSVFFLCSTLPEISFNSLLNNYRVFNTSCSRCILVYVTSCDGDISCVEIVRVEIN